LRHVRAIVFGTFPKSVDAGAFVASHLSFRPARVRFIFKVTRTLFDIYANVSFDIQGLSHGAVTSGDAVGLHFARPKRVLSLDEFASLETASVLFRSSATFVINHSAIATHSASPIVDFFSPRENLFGVLISLVGAGGGVRGQSRARTRFGGVTSRHARADVGHAKVEIRLRIHVIVTIREWHLHDGVADVLGHILADDGARSDDLCGVDFFASRIRSPRIPKRHVVAQDVALGSHKVVFLLVVEGADQSVDSPLERRIHAQIDARSDVPRQRPADPRVDLHHVGVGTFVGGREGVEQRRGERQSHLAAVDQQLQIAGRGRMDSHKKIRVDLDLDGSCAVYVVVRSTIVILQPNAKRVFVGSGILQHHGLHQDVSASAVEAKVGTVEGRVPRIPSNHRGTGTLKILTKPFTLMAYTLITISHDQVLRRIVSSSIWARTVDLRYAFLVVRVPN
jgi:hypothetical protein